VITDNMTAALMRKMPIVLVVVGADRIAANGDTANKIGTYGVAVLAREHKVPFYVAAPLSTIDLNTPDGDHIPIEERNEAEVLGAWGTLVTTRSSRKLSSPKSQSSPQSSKLSYVRVANPASTARNPGFDVTPAELITGIITPAGVFKPTELWPRRRELGWDA